MLIKDKQANSNNYSVGGTLAASVLESTTTINGVISPYNSNNVQRFRILYDKRVKLSNHGLAYTSTDVLTTSAEISQGKKKIKSKFKVHYPGAANNNPITNGLFLLFFTNNNVATVDAAYYIKVIYKDA